MPCPEGARPIVSCYDQRRHPHRRLHSMDLAIHYGVNETNPIWASEANHTNVDYDEYCTLGDPRLARIVRLRLLTDYGYPFYDISYCYGQLTDGRYVRLSDDPGRLSRKNLKGDLIAWARREGVNAKRLGLLDEGNWSILR